MEHKWIMLHARSMKKQASLMIENRRSFPLNTVDDFHTENTDKKWKEALLFSRRAA